MTQRFVGELEWIDPNFLVTKDEDEKVEAFFLGLGAVFNDMKGLILFEKMLVENYDAPATDEVSSHAGDYGGVMVQIQKLMVSTIHEFFIFLKKSSPVYTTSEFKGVLSRMAKRDRQFWEALVAAAHGKLSSVSDLLETIVKVRSNIAYHYDHSGKILRSAYVSRFLGKIENARAERAYYSIGESIATTRFYFSDAAVEEALFIAAGKERGEKYEGNEALKKHKELVRDTIDVMSTTIAILMKCYIQSRRNRPHAAQR